MVFHGLRQRIERGSGFTSIGEHLRLSNRCLRGQEVARTPREKRLICLARMLLRNLPDRRFGVTNAIHEPDRDHLRLAIATKRRKRGVAA